MGVMDEAEEIHLTTAAEWRAWLEENGGRHDGVWLVSYKQRTGKPAVGYEEAVCEALCFGWIDSTYRRIDDERGARWWSPRRKGSLWARTNKERVAWLEAEGRMTDAGRAAIERALADGSWAILESVEALIVPDDLGSAMDARPGARDRWAALTPSAQRAHLFHIVSAKRAPTRERRVRETVDDLTEGHLPQDR